MFVLLSVTLCFLGYLLCLNLIYDRFNKIWPSSWNCILRSSSRAKGVNFLRAFDEVRVLLVTAHPDDECMFFAPAVIKLTESNAAVYLLCLSSGNYYNQGAQRKEELLGSCAVLGIPAHRVTIVDNKELQDDPKTEWSIALTAPLILKHITTYSINLAIKALIKSPSTGDLHKQTTANKLAERVLTFDERGSERSCQSHRNLQSAQFSDLVSWVKRDEREREVALWWAKPGHHGDFQELGYGFRAPSNHTHLAFAGRLPEDCQVLSLHTISILRKYLSILELPISWLLPSSFCCIIGPNEYRKAKEAMFHHRSQLLWFRHLYILFSRYMFVNTFRAVPVENNDGGQFHNYKQIKC
ncbi:hypothetical protein QTP70_028563 [Hemibagrus guttatus]|uniref:N-acetylglucosaminylphosphatidylinositol deacetylase n=1 Tax=Hemibagrus guttatus TaxID=175788 RepID=A0AAE0PWS5_9TELE|nr:hypothetical protein QTP70_028563 [Hemibagrus guttatus]